jgi:hypothetical protein
MNNAYIPALAALAGSAIGALASFATTWLTQHSQERAQRYAQAMTVREQLYGGFIEEASKLFTDALTHELDDPLKFVALYALVAKLRLFASPSVIANAEQVMRRIVETYNLPNRDYRKPVDIEEQPEQDLLRGFSEACRGDLHV